jgi:hypothetical protein
MPVPIGKSDLNLYLYCLAGMIMMKEYKRSGISWGTCTLTHVKMSYI